MNRAKRPIIGVVAAEANCIEQRQILEGIVEQAQKLGYDTAVITNVFNTQNEDSPMFSENEVYDLILSEDISAIIIISESFVNETLRKKVASYLARRNIPIISVGSLHDEFKPFVFRSINTSDENDTEEITSHLIEEHGYTSIDLLTGYDYVDVSHNRAEGYRKALKKHGMPVDESKIHFGDFWMNSGKELAEKYIRGELPMPQALICANDYMAFGVLDVFVRNSISVPDQIAVVGYEYIDKRTLYSPLLTTYQRNRAELGRSAIHIIHEKLCFNLDYEFLPPSGTLIKGDSCPCGRDNTQFYQELDLLKAKKDYEFWNLYSSLDQELTLSRNLEEFSATLGSFHWLLRNTASIILCLYSNWYDTNSPASDIMTCRQIVPWAESTPLEISKYDFASFFALHSEPSVYYFDPLYFGSHPLGFIILRYDEPDTYDDIFRNWIKTVSNSLEFLRMKNDIQYLSKCQNLSEQRDTLTGMFNSQGIKKAYNSAVVHGDKELYMVLLKVCLFEESSSQLSNDKRIDAILDASKAISKFCGNHDVCGRISDNTFICLVQSNASPDTLSDCLASILIQHRKYMENFGMDSFICTAEKCSDSSFADIIRICSEKADRLISSISERRLTSHYNQLSEIRNYVYMNPIETFDTTELHKRFSGSTGYFRSIYKQCFGSSFHKDCISARIAKAKYQLSTTTLSVMEISEKCGYLDSKYFLRQFSASAGMTPIQFRNLLKS